MRKVHLGGKLDDNLEFSNRTYELDTKTTVSAVKDVVRGQLTEAKQVGLLDALRRAGEEEVDWAKIKGQLAKSLSKDELRRADEAFTGPDVVNLPPGNTAWRASNALSWIAHTVDTADRKLELEKIAGGLLKGQVGEAA
jgi:hypothetical protein